MSKSCVVLVTGAGGDAQGWGNMHVTEAVRDAILANGHDCRIVLAENRAELEKRLAAEGEFFPPPERIFAALEATPLAEVRCVLLGQDPYHEPGQAMVVSF